MTILQEMTLEQYEKLLLEKRKALESLKTKERRVTPDKEFESMQLVEKKKEDGHSTKLVCIQASFFVMVYFFDRHSVSVILVIVLYPVILEHVFIYLWVSEI